MDKRMARKALYAAAIAVSVVAIIGIMCSLLCIAHGNLKASVLLVVCVGLIWAADGVANALDRRGI